MITAPTTRPPISPMPRYGAQDASVAVSAPETEIGAKFNALRDAIEELNNAIGLLDNRLVPVTRPVPASPLNETAAEDPGSLSPIARGLLEQTGRIREAAFRLYAMKDALGV